MLQGHGDDIYQYPDIRMNFSSNIFAHADMSELKAHLCRNIHLIDNYPEPSPRSLERLIANKAGVSPDSVLVTNGATEAIYLIAQTLASAQSGQASVWSSQASVHLGLVSVRSSQVESAPHIAPCTHFCTSPLPTFSEYTDASLLHGLKEEKWSPATSPIEPMMPITPNNPITLLWLCNPNNPTGSIYTSQRKMQP